MVLCWPSGFFGTSEGTQGTSAQWYQQWHMCQRLPQGLANGPDNTFVNDVHAFDIEAGFAAVIQLYFFAAVAWVQGCKSHQWGARVTTPKQTRRWIISSDMVMNPWMVQKRKYLALVHNTGRQPAADNKSIYSFGEIIYVFVFSRFYGQRPAKHSETIMVVSFCAFTSQPCSGVFQKPSSGVFQKQGHVFHVDPSDRHENHKLTNDPNLLQLPAWCWCVAERALFGCSGLQSANN